MPTKEEKRITDLVVLRVLVAFLGEKGQCDWWDTDFLGPTGLQFLEINFPRSAISAGCNAAGEAAKRLHDEFIGKGGVYHLFRLPSSVEEAVHRQLLETDPESILSSITDTETALNSLGQFVRTPVDAPEGPVQIGTIKNMTGRFAMEEMAKHYHDAFSREKMCFPYFTQ